MHAFWKNHKYLRRLTLVVVLLPASVVLIAFEVLAESTTSAISYTKATVRTTVQTLKSIW